MAIEILPNQPVLFRPVGWEEPCPCENCEPDCMLVQHSDYIYAQVKMNPCGDDFICGQPVTGPELVVNGIFDTDTGWQEAGNNWTIAGGKACYTAADGGGVLYQTIAGLIVGRVYRLSFTISDFVAGTLTPFLWGNTGTGVTANGDYTQDITLTLSSNSFLDFVDNAWNGCITNISLVEMPFDCWDTSFSGDDPFNFTEEAVCVQGTGNLFTATLANTPGYYVASFTISNYISGTVSVKGACTDTWVGSPFTLNGEKFAYGVFAGAGVLCFEFTNFYGCISDIHLHRLYIPQFVVENTETGQQYLDLNSGAFLSFVEDRAIIKFRPLEFLPYDCYKICIIDTCILAGVTNKVTNGTFDSDLADWAAGSGWSWDISNGGEALFDRATGTGALSQEFSVSDINVCVRMTVYDIAGAGAFVRLHLYDAANNSVTFLDITTPGVYTICGTGNRVDVEPSNSAGTVVEVDNIGVFQITDCADCSPYDYCSNCIKFAQSFDSCVLLLESRENSNGAWGFVWNNSAGANIFKLSHRVPSQLWNTSYPEESNDYTFSGGKTDDTFAQSDKFWTLGIKMECGSERTHDVIRLQKRSRHFVITDVNGSNEYWSDKGDYNPDWPQGGCRAPASFKVKLKTSTLFNNLCST